MRRAIAGALLGVTLSACAGSASSGPAPEPDVSWDPAQKIHGVSLSAPPRPMPAEALAPVADLGADWIAIIPFAFVDPEAPEVVFQERAGDRRQFWGETLEGVATTVDHARAQGLKVLLKPHLWVRGQGWPGEFRPGGEAEWETFLSGYRHYILRFAELADSMSIDMFAVGTEVDIVAIERPDYWRELIAEVREIFGGTLTYAANWDRYSEIAFWDALDLVGVDAYFPLVDDPTPEIEELVAAWEEWGDELGALTARVGRPILFTEFGYRSMDGAAGKQWTLPDGRQAQGVARNDEAQAAAYEALFRVWWDRPWFAGGFLWKWYPGTPTGERFATDFTPQGKSAEAVISKWYGGARSAGALPRD